MGDLLLSIKSKILNENGYADLFLEKSKYDLNVLDETMTFSQNRKLILLYLSAKL